MKTILLPITLIAMTSFSTQASTVPTNEEARSIAKQFLGKLKPELQKGMKSGGPVHTVEVCHIKAPKIAADLAQKTGWGINRVSLKPRGATATPDAWETAVLEKFNAQLAAGAKAKGLEFSEIVSVNGQSEFRYMKAIPTGGVCLTCHGEAVPTKVKEAIHTVYPNDQATGYKLGQIRGAFSFTKTL